MVTGWEVGGNVVVVLVLCGFQGARVTGCQGVRVVDPQGRFSHCVIA